MEKVGYIGIGIMGSGICVNLARKGAAVDFVVHRSRENVRRLLDAGAREVSDYAALSRENRVIMMTLPDSSVVEPLLLGPDGLGPHLREGQIVVDMSTSYPPSTRRIAEELGRRGVTLLDAPLTGSRPQAEAGTLNVMCGGPQDAYARVKPLFDAFAANVFHVGETGSGHTIKLINNYLGQVSIAAICEMLPLSAAYGVDPGALFDVVRVSGGNSKAFEGLMPRLMKRDFSVAFQQKFVRKDVRYFNDLAREAGVFSPVAETLRAIHDKAFEKGYGERDFSSLLEYYERKQDTGADDRATT